MERPEQGLLDTNYEGKPMTTPRPDGGQAGIYRVRRTYPMTEVFGWWFTSTKTSPRWVPVMGELHEDSRFFRFNLLHYHVDPRFLEPKVNDEVQRSLHGWTRWHAAYTEVLAYFAIEGDAEHYFTLTPDATLMFARDGGVIEGNLDRAWGEARIQRRTRNVRCYRRMPRRLPDPQAQGFTKLRETYPDAAGDACPHRGYDLRNVPIDADGYRQCPLHQLRTSTGRRPG